MDDVVKIPDGKGGYVDAPAQRFAGSQADAEKQAQVMAEAAAKAHWERVGAAAENFNLAHKAYAIDKALTEEEVVKAMYLELLNWKEFYPAELGGKERIDTLCHETWDWFCANRG